MLRWASLWSLGSLANAHITIIGLPAILRPAHTVNSYDTDVNIEIDTHDSC